MAADSPGTTPLQHLTIAERRRAERRGCRLAARVCTRQAELHGRVTDISAGGIGLHVEGFLVLRPGEELRVALPDLGDARCVVRWAAHPRYGAEFTGGAGLSARLRAFYDGLPRDPGRID